MRRSLLASLVLACGGVLFALGANATPIHVGLTGAAGQHKWDSPGFGDPSYLHLSAWQSDGNGGWDEAWMTSGTDGSGNSGLGVCAVDPSQNDNFCPNATQPDPTETNEIDSIPEQMIDMDITGLASNWTKLTITLLSVETGQLLQGVDCSILTDTNCAPTPFDLDPNASFCSAADLNHIVTCVFTEQYLSQRGVTDIWIQSVPASGCELSPCSLNGNILLGSGLDNGFIMDGTPASVPEPAALGMFGLGTLLIGVFLGLRRRRLQ